MGSSASKNRGKQAGLLGLGGSAPTGTQKSPNAAGKLVDRTFFNPGSVPATGGLVRPQGMGAPGGPPAGGMAMNWMMPTPNPQRNNLAQTMRQRWGDEVLFGSQPGRGYGEGKSRGWGGSLGAGAGGHYR